MSERLTNLIVLRFWIKGDVMFSCMLTYDFLMRMFSGFPIDGRKNTDGGNNGSNWKIRGG